MTILTATDLAAMKAAQVTALPGTCSISRRSMVADTMGGYTETWADLATGVACRLVVMRAPTEALVAARFAGMELWQLTLPAAQAITHNDRVVISDVTYEVAGINSGGEWETARRVTLARVD